MLQRVMFIFVIFVGCHKSFNLRYIKCQNHNKTIIYITYRVNQKLSENLLRGHNLHLTIENNVLKFLFFIFSYHLMRRPISFKQLTNLHKHILLNFLSETCF